MTTEVTATKRQNDSGGFDDYWLINADWDVTGQAGPFHMQILPDFGAGENSNTLLQFEMFADRATNASGIFAQLSQWSLDNGATEVVQGLFGDLPTAVLELSLIHI